MEILDCYSFRINVMGMQLDDLNTNSNFSQVKPNALMTFLRIQHTNKIAKVFRSGKRCILSEKLAISSETQALWTVVDTIIVKSSTNYFPEIVISHLCKLTQLELRAFVNFLKNASIDFLEMGLNRQVFEPAIVVRKTLSRRKIFLLTHLIRD